MLTPYKYQYYFYINPALSSVFPTKQSYVPWYLETTEAAKASYHVMKGHNVELPHHCFQKMTSILYPQLKTPLGAERVSDTDRVTASHSYMKRFLPSAFIDNVSIFML